MSNFSFSNSSKKKFNLSKPPVFFSENNFFEDLEQGHITITKAEDHKIFHELSEKTKEKIGKKIGIVDYMGFTLAINKEILYFTGHPGWSVLNHEIQKTASTPIHQRLLSLKEGFFSAVSSPVINCYVNLVRAKYFGFRANGVSLYFIDEETGVKISSFFVFKGNDISFMGNNFKKEELFKLVVEDMQNYLPAYAAFLNFGNTEKSSIDNILSAITYGINIKDLFSGMYR